MSKYVIDSATLTDIADAIRAKTKDTATMTPADMPDEIESIEGGNPALLHLMLYRTLEDYAGGTPVSEIDLEDATEVSDYLFYGTGRNRYYNSVRGSYIKVIHSSAFNSNVGSAIDLAKSLTSVSFPVLETCWNSCFAYTPITTFTAPNTLTDLGTNTFQNCAQLTKLDLSAATELTSLGAQVCSYCTSLAELILPPNVQRIGNYCFQACRGLTTVTIPASVTNLNQYAFYLCSGLKTVRFSGTPAASGGIGYNAFGSCSALTDIYVPWSQGAVSGAPWGATNATIHYNSTT